MKEMYQMLLASSNDITNTWGWAAGICVFVVDHWSGLAAFMIFATQMYINVRNIIRKGK